MADRRRSECPMCQRGFEFIASGGPCSVCFACCDCCLCGTEESLPDQEEHMLWKWFLASSSAGDLFLSSGPKSAKSWQSDPDQFRRNMVKIAIWPHTMRDDEIIFDPKTGRLVDDVAKKVERYLRNLGKSSLDEDSSPTASV